MKKQKPVLKIGFDMDGVILYNPARIVRPIIVFIKKILLKKEINKFHYPKTKLQQLIWFLLHKSSMWIAPGMDELKSQITENKIEAYIVSARYESLKTDFEKWLKKIEAEKYFKGCYFNNQNEQPYLFKEKMIKKLDLDIFVEDNWDIARYLNQKTNAKIFWIYNLLDRNINYQYKFPSLKKVVLQITKLTKGI